MAKRYNKNEKNNSNKENEKRLIAVPKKKKKKKRILRKIIGTFFILFFILVCAFAGVLIGVINGTEKLTKEDLTYNNLTTFIYDRNGNEYATLYNEENRMLVSLNEMPKYLPKAFMAIEDERFETHFGVDIKRTGYAIFTYVINGGKSKFGGSTITQQLVKNITGDNKSDPIRKVREWIRAVQVETWLSKEEIIEMYLNIIFLGGDCYGVQSASYNIFGKDVSKLSLAECAVLAGITHSPNAYNGQKDYDKVKGRQEVVLNKMLELGMISQEEYTEAVNQKLEFMTTEISNSTSYIVEAVIDEVIADIMKEKKTTKALASKMVYSDGLKIYTNIDPEIQLAMEKVYVDSSYFPIDKNYEETPQSAMVIIENGTGAIVGLVGGAGEKVARGLNRATNSLRQPGSTIKPIAVYGPAIDSKVVTAATVYDDIPTKMGSWVVHNWDGVYAGLSTVRTGIEKSMNIVAVKTLKDLGVANSYMYLEKMGVTSLVESDKVLTLALGGITYGISPLQMCGAYSTIANQGQYIEPSIYSKVEDKMGAVLVSNTQAIREVFSKQSAYITLDMMRDVVTGASGTAKYVNIGGNPVAGKTGSTDENKDRWFCGITPYYTGAVWFGFDQPKRIRISGQNPAAKIWNAVMKEVHTDLEKKNFTKPTGLVTAKICMDSGKLATDLCANDQRGTRVREELFIAGTVPTDTCQVHVSTEICSECNKLYCINCPDSLRVTKVFLQRSVLLDGVESAKDYMYELPTEICDHHLFNPIINSNTDNESEIEGKTNEEKPSSNVSVNTTQEGYF